MPQNFVGCDREQSFLMPPDRRDWLPEGHLAWFILETVRELDLAPFYASYRVDGWGRAAFEPEMMLSLLLYAYARGERSSRGIERRCVEDVAYRVIAAQQAPDHATITRFRVRHEEALAELFTEVLSLCKEAGLVKVGLIAIDGTKVHANASHHSNLGYEQLAREILKEAARIDAAEDELYGEKRGDELPEHLRTSEGRRAALADARRKLERDRAKGSTDAEMADGTQSPGVALKLDPEVIVARVQGRRGWEREAQHQLEEHRRVQADPIPRSRSARLLEAERRLAENLAVEREANEAYEHHRATAVTSDGRRFGARPNPYEPPDTPPGKINTTDLDSRNVKTPRSYTQGYNAQAVVNEHQVVLAAEVTLSSPDFGHLQPMVEATNKELEAIGVTETPGVAVADSGYWHEQQMNNVIGAGTEVLIPPDAGKRATPRRGWTGGRYAWMRTVLETDYGGGLYRRRKAMVEPVFAQTKHNRRIDSFQRRGRSAVRSEWRLITATHNLMKLHKHQIAAAGARQGPSRRSTPHERNHRSIGATPAPQRAPFCDTHDDQQARSLRRLLATKPAVSGGRLARRRAAPSDESEQRRCEPRSASTAAQIRALQHSGIAFTEWRNQAIAKAGAVRGNAARLLGAPTLCLCKRRDRRSLVARMLLVDGHGVRRWAAEFVAGSRRVTATMAPRRPRARPSPPLPPVTSAPQDLRDVSAVMPVPRLPARPRAAARRLAAATARCASARGRRGGLSPTA